MTAAHHLGDVDGLVLRIARIDALRREAQEEILAHLRGPILASMGSTSFVGGAGIGGGFQDDQHARRESAGRSPGRRTTMKLMSGSLVLRSGVGTQMLMVSSPRRRRNRWWRAVSRLRPAGPASTLGISSDVGIAGVDAADLFLADIDAGDREAGLGEFHRQRKPDVAQARRCRPGRAGCGSSRREWRQWRR